MIENKIALNNAVMTIGKTDWYLLLHYRRFLKIINILSNEMIAGAAGLEIGVWPGYLGVALNNLGFKMSATDLEPERLTNLDIPVVKLDLNSETIPFSDNSFDFIIFSEVVEHLNPDRVISVLKEINRVLNPGGVLILSTPNSRRLGTKLSKTENHTINNGHGHEKEYSLDEMVQLINQTDLKVVVAHAVSFYSGVGRSDDNTYFYPLIDFMRHPRKLNNSLKIIFYPLLKLVPQFRDSLLIVAKKST